MPLDWTVRFVLLCTIMALLEEVITTTMTNLAPVFGMTPEEAHIATSTNDLKVVCFHSVVVFVPMFIAGLDAVPLGFFAVEGAAVVRDHRVDGRGQHQPDQPI